MPELQHTPHLATLTDWIRTLQNTWPMVHKVLEEPWDAYKIQADKRRAPQKEFKVGDKVYLSTKFMQSRQPCKKLGPKYVGPLPITRVLNSVTVELKLTKNLKCIHPAFHCSLLKPVTDSPSSCHEATSPSHPNRRTFRDQGNP